LFSGIKPEEDLNYIFNCLEDITEMGTPSELHGKCLQAENTDKLEFVEMLKKMLALDPVRLLLPFTRNQYFFLFVSIISFIFIHGLQNKKG
jgi:hypothetical protein